MAIRFDYSRAGLWMSLRVSGWRGRTGIAVLVTAALWMPAGAWAQYPGQIATANKTTPELRSIAVLEWIGEEGKPARSRLVPVAVLDQGELQDGGVYLARPMPMALDNGVEYELEQNGKAIGYYDVKAAGEQMGSWMGFGQWKPLVKEAPKPPPQLAHIDEDDSGDGGPVLHRKHHSDDSSTGGSGSAPPPDSDRPTLHRNDTSGSSSGNSGSNGSSNGGSTSGSSGSPSTNSSSDGPVLHRRDSSGDSGSNGTGGSSTGSGSSSAPAPDPDRPTLHRPSSDDDTASGNAPDPDRPRLKRNQNSDDEANVQPVRDAIDPDRPRLRRGVFADAEPVLPKLIGLPPEMQQMVAVSDAQPIPEHLWSYSWANPDDEKKMQAALEAIAVKELTPKVAEPAAAPVRTAARRKKPTAPAPPPVTLEDEQFRVFELAYGSGATMVFSAHTEGQGAQEKFITLIAQPDLYGNPLVLLKNVTDAAHLDDTPHMRLIDAVDAMADNRGELLFELRGATQRQFALYRVLRGQIQKLFVSGSLPLGGA